MNTICLEYAPNNSHFLYTNALILFRKNNFLDAKIYIENSINNMNFPKVEYLDLCGDILYKLGEHEAAILQWTKASKIDNTNIKIKEKLKQ